MGVGPTEAGTEPTSGVEAAMVPKTASKSDQTALSHRCREVGTQRIAISRSMAMLGRATLLSGPDDLPASQERGRSLEAARLAVPPRGEGRGRKDARSGWGGARHDPRLASRMEVGGGQRTRSVL